MIIIPGFLMSLLTFPGVIVHEFAHQLACRLCNLCVFEVQYYKFSTDKVAGYVTHERTNSPGKSLLVTYGPLILNTIIGTLFVFPLSMMLAMSEMSYSFEYPIWAKIVTIILAYIGISCLANAFPSSGDAKSLFTSVLKTDETPIIAKIFIAPFIAIIYVFSIAKIVWIDFAYAYGVIILLKFILLH